MSHTAAEIDKLVKRYIIIGMSLLALTGVTVAVAYSDTLNAMPTAVGVTVALVIATFKASLVGAIFMHLNAEKKTIYWTLVLTVAFFFVLLLVPLFISMDGIGS